MNTVALEDIITWTLICFFGSLKELGCPEGANPQTWYDALDDDEKKRVSDKLLEIIERKD